MKPVVDGLEKEFSGKVEFRRYNVERDAAGIQLADGMGVTAVPTYVFVNSDGLQAGTRVGGMSPQDMKSSLEALQ